MGDSTDGIPGIPGLGPKTADAIIDNMPDVLSHHSVVLSQYLAKFRLDEGVSRFYETFKLVRMHTNIDIAEKDVGEIPRELFTPVSKPDMALTQIEEEDDSWE